MKRIAPFIILLLLASCSMFLLFVVSPPTICQYCHKQVGINSPPLIVTMFTKYSHVECRIKNQSLYYGPPTPNPHPYAIWRSGEEARRRDRPVVAQKPDDYRELQEAFDRIDVNNRDILRCLAEIKQIIRERLE